MKYVSWDIGNVILPHLDLDNIIEKLAQLLGTSVYALMGFFNRPSDKGHVWYDIESGMDAVQIYYLILKEFGHDPENISLYEFSRAWNAILNYTKADIRHFERIEFLSETIAHAGTRQCLLSNINPIHIDIIVDAMERHTPRFLKHIPRNHRFYSCNLKMVKCEKPDIYLHVCKALGIAPQDFCHIDDRSENIVGAKAAGCHAILCNGSVYSVATQLKHLQFI